MFHDDDDFMDDYYEYKMFENSMKQSEPLRKAGQGKPTSPPPIRMTKPSSDLGCSGWIAIICIVIALISLFGSCGKSSSKSYSSGSSRRLYSTSSYSSSSKSTSTSNSYSGSSRSNTSESVKAKGSSSDPYDAKSYYHPDDFYYDHYDDFWDYEDAEDYWEEHLNN